MDLTGKLREGGNHLEVKVTNLWVNRIIGDEQLPADVEWVGTHLKGWPAWLGWPNSTTDPSANLKSKRTTGRYTFSTWKYWSKDSPLLESGLIGPVKLISAQKVAVK